VLGAYSLTSKFDIICLQVGPCEREALSFQQTRLRAQLWPVSGSSHPWPGKKGRFAAVLEQKEAESTEKEDLCLLGSLLFDSSQSVSSNSE